jgi:iron complex transport system permease protein
MLLLAVTLVLFVMTIAVGTNWIPIEDVIHSLAGHTDPATDLIVQRLRLPRAVVAVLVGVALAIAGALVQAATRNPLATPDVIGVTAGASCGAVAVLLAFDGVTFGFGGAAAEVTQVGVPVGAVMGALVAAAVVLGLATTNSCVSGPRFTTQRVVLAGIVVHAACIGLVHWALTVGDIDQASKAQVWLVGSLHGRGWEHVTAVAMALAVLLPLSVAVARQLDVLGLGEDCAATLGIAVRRTQLLTFIVAFALVGTSVAAAGPVDFIALLAAHIARRLMRTPAVSVIATGLTGAVLLLAADLVARFLIPGHELPAGAVTALVGAPYLLWLIVRSGGR